MKKKNTLISLFVSSAMLLFFLSSADARVYLDITSPDFRKIPMTVPYFEDKSRPGTSSETGKEMADIMSRALTFHGFISIIPPSIYGGKQNSDWQALGAEFSILGQYDSSPSGIMLELRLLDIHQGRIITGKRYRGTLDKYRQMLYKFCDEAILNLTGEPGISLTKIAYVSDKTGSREIFLSDILGDEIRQVTYHRHLTVSPRFSPDGAKLAYTSYHRNNPDLYVTDLSQVRITKAISFRQGLNLAPAWSPDGKTMAVTLSIDDTPDIYLMNTKGDILKRITRNAGINVSASWSPDGKQLAFVSDRSGTPQIYVMNVKTGSVRRITFHGKENSTPSWSPKGEWIAYTGRYNGNLQIFIIKPWEGKPVQLTRYWGNHESPSWSPDGRQIVFSRLRNEKQELCAIFKNGTGCRPIFKLKEKQNYPQWSPRLKL
ncbi:MAG: Tol-Pal system beta propeller repeat protein TolB [Thermodesulfobacteriota bacterium]|nr:Tol-Pal system beta propeller repeat protein TolB [Thermodesulfobacteriota bacterium]